MYKSDLKYRVKQLIKTKERTKSNYRKKWNYCY